MNLLDENFNPKKKLVQFGESGKVFKNPRVKHILRKWRKGAQEGCDFFYINGQPLFFLGGMIYWYAIGEKQFDVRHMRENAGFPIKNDETDLNFKMRYESIQYVAKQLDEIAQKQDIKQFLDRILSPIDLSIY